MINTQEFLSKHLIRITILVILGYSLSASAHPEMPHTFYGYIPDASDGQIVTATVNNISISSIVLEGWYVNLDVPADDPETLELEGGRNGDIIYFSVDGQYIIIPLNRIQMTVLVVAVEIEMSALKHLKTSN